MVLQIHKNHEKSSYKDIGLHVNIIKNIRICFAL
jgi:hypothetical protein